MECDGSEKDFNTIVLESKANEINLWHIAMIKIEFVLG